MLAGYAGGASSTAEYETVSTGTTGHAESVQITYDRHSFRTVKFCGCSSRWSMILPNSTGRVRIRARNTAPTFFIWTMPQNVAQAYIAQLNSAKVFSQPIVTRVDAYKGFYPAEAYRRTS